MLAPVIVPVFTKPAAVASAKEAEAAVDKADRSLGEKADEEMAEAKAAPFSSSSSSLPSTTTKKDVVRSAPAVAAANAPPRPR
ncbi:hypothetical protein FALCPG4_006281 [Fusarium falciforme]